MPSPANSPSSRRVSNGFRCGRASIPARERRADEQRMRLAINVRPLVTGKIGGMETYVRNIVACLAQRRDVEEICLLTSAQSHGVLAGSDTRVHEVLIG